MHCITLSNPEYKMGKEIGSYIHKYALQPPKYHACGNHSAHDIKEVCNVNMDALE